MPHSLETIERIKQKHGLHGEAALSPFMGDVNEAWQIGDEYILRINRREECDDEAEREALVVPRVRAAGIRTPELIACSYDADIVERPYTIYRRAPGVLLGGLDIDPAILSDLYREIGRELALLHRLPVPENLVAGLDRKPWDARKQLQRGVDANVMSDEELAEMEKWLGGIESQMGELKIDSLIHCDIHPWNLLVDPNTYELTAILDWGDSMIGDVASEFSSMPLVAVPHMLAGYEEAGETVDNSIIAKSIFWGIGLAAWEQRMGTPDTYRRQWWRLPIGGWPVTREFLTKTFPNLIA